MYGLMVLFILALGVNAAPSDVGGQASPKTSDASVSVRCSLSIDNGVDIQGVKKSVYLCSSDSKDESFLLVSDSKEPNLNALIAKDALPKLDELSMTPKRRFGGGGFGRPGFGGGGGGAFANSQASAFGGGFGRPGYGGGGAFANSQASAGGFGFGR